MRDDDLTRALRSAVALLEVAPLPPADEVLQAGTRRRRRRQVGSAVAMTGVAALALVLLVAPTTTENRAPSVSGAADAIVADWAAAWQWFGQAKGAQAVVGWGLLAVATLLTLTTVVIALLRRATLPARLLVGVVAVSLGSGTTGLVQVLLEILSRSPATWTVRWLDLLGVAGSCVVVPAACAWALARSRTPAGLAGSFAVAAAVSGTPLWFLGGSAVWTACSLVVAPLHWRWLGVPVLVALLGGLALWGSGLRLLSEQRVERRRLWLVLLLQTLVGLGILLYEYGSFLRHQFSTVWLYAAADTLALTISTVLVTAMFAATAIAVAPRKLPRATAWVLALGTALPFAFAIVARHLPLLVSSIGVTAALLELSGGLVVLGCLLVWLRRNPASDVEGPDHDQPASDAVAA